MKSVEAIVRPVRKIRKIFQLMNAILKRRAQIEEGKNKTE